MRDFDPTAGEFAGHDAIRPSNRHYDMGSILGAGASIVGGMMGADAAEDAANIQAGATREANALQQKQYDQTRTDLAPFRGLGVGAANMLAQYLGIGGGVGGAGALGDIESRDAIRARLESQFKNQKTPIWSQQMNGSEPTNDYYISGYENGLDETGLNAAIDAEIAKQRAAQAQGAQTAQNSPNFGALLKNFTGADLASEPGYQFGLKEGQRALDNRLASAGSYFSGAALKAASRYNQDYAGTKYGEAFNRDSANKTRIYNFLSGATGVGQNAAAMTGNAGQTMAGQVGANTTAMGNAAGAARIASGNAWGNAIQNAVGGYQQNQLMDRILGGNRGMGGGSSSRGYTVPIYENPDY